MFPIYLVLFVGAQADIFTEALYGVARVML